jgi:hypothetical protein
MQTPDQVIADLQAQCEYNAEEDSTIDSLIAYKDALEDLYTSLLASTAAPCIRFTGESAETFANTLQHFAGYTVEIVSEDDDVAPFDATLIGSAPHTGDYFGVDYRDFDEDTGEAVGDVKSIIVKELRIY